MKIIIARLHCWLHCHIWALTERHIATYKWGGWDGKLNSLECSCRKAFWPPGRVFYQKHGISRHDYYEERKKKCA